MQCVLHAVRSLTRGPKERQRYLREHRTGVLRMAYVIAITFIIVLAFVLFYVPSEDANGDQEQRGRICESSALLGIDGRSDS